MARTVGTAITTVAVYMFDDNGSPRFVLSQTTMPSSAVTLTITNKCTGYCSFNLLGSRAGTLLGPGESETWTVALRAGRYAYHCDAAPDIMKGAFDVTP